MFQVSSLGWSTSFRRLGRSLRPPSLKQTALKPTQWNRLMRMRTQMRDSRMWRTTPFLSSPQHHLASTCQHPLRRRRPGYADSGHPHHRHRLDCPACLFQDDTRPEPHQPGHNHHNRDLPRGSHHHHHHHHLTALRRWSPLLDHLVKILK